MKNDSFSLLKILLLPDPLLLLILKKSSFFTLMLYEMNTFRICIIIIDCYMDTSSFPKNIFLHFLNTIINQANINELHFQCILLLKLQPNNFQINLFTEGWMQLPREFNVLWNSSRSFLPLFVLPAKRLQQPISLSQFTCKIVCW